MDLINQLNVNYVGLTVLTCAECYRQKASFILIHSYSSDELRSSKLKIKALTYWLELRPVWIVLQYYVVKASQT